MVSEVGQVFTGDPSVSGDAMRSYPDPYAEQKRQESELFDRLAARVSADSGMPVDEALTAIRDISARGPDSDHLACLLPTARTIEVAAKMLDEAGPAHELDALRIMFPGLASALVQIVKAEYQAEQEARSVR